jgi:hypothetical protein
MNDTLLIEKTRSQTVVQAVGAVNVGLYHLFSHPLIHECCEFTELEYGFGDFIVKDSQLQAPEGQILSLAEKDPNDYFLVVLSKPLEQFFSLPSRIISLNIFTPGSIIQLPQCQRAFAGDFDLPWQLSAGMRTLFLLPKITDNMGYNRLRLAYQLTSMKPLRNLYDQWHLFRQIAQHADIAQSWRAKVLLVSKRSVLTEKAEALWQTVQHYVQKDQSKLLVENSRSIAFDIVWQRFLEVVDPRRFKLKPHLVETIKYLYAMCTGAAPGFIPASCQDSVAPISDLRQAFTEVYKLRNYVPTFLHLSFVNIHIPKMLYYSLAVPQLINYPANHMMVPTSQRELFELKQTIEVIKKHIHSPVFEQYQLKFFHVAGNEALGLEPSVHVPEEDPRFFAGNENQSNREFCASSIFWRGCLRLQKE